eukprot:300293-Rhodomonas_salina.1
MRGKATCLLQRTNLVCTGDSSYQFGRVQCAVAFFAFVGTGQVFERAWGACFAPSLGHRVAGITSTLGNVHAAFCRHGVLGARNTSGRGLSQQPL